MTRLSGIDDVALKNRALAGESSTQIGAALGCGRIAVMRRAEKLGIEVTGNQKPNVKSIEKAVADMSSGDAVQFLLELIRQLVPALGEDEVMKVCHHGFTATEAQVLLMIFGDRFVAKEAIYNAIYGSRASGELTDPKIIDVFVCKIRKKLVAKGWNAVIHTTWGRGFRGERVDGFMFPWEAN